MFKIILIILILASAVRPDTTEKPKAGILAQMGDDLPSMLTNFMSDSQTSSLAQKYMSELASSINLEHLAKYFQDPAYRVCWLKVFERLIRTKLVDYSNCIVLNKGLINAVGKHILNGCREKKNMVDCLSVMHISLFDNLDKIHLDVLGLAIKELFGGMDKSCVGDSYKQVRLYIGIMNECEPDNEDEDDDETPKKIDKKEEL